MIGVILPKQPVPHDEAYMLIRKNLQMLSDAVGTGGSGIVEVVSEAPLTGEGTTASPLSIPAADTDTNGYLTDEDWDTFNNKEPALTKGNLTAVAPLVFNNTRRVIDGAAAVSIPKATGSVDGYLDHDDWTTFNSKSQIHKAFASVAAGASTTIACYLDTDNTGDTVTVNCSVIGTANLNAAVPRLADGSLIFVVNFGTVETPDWWCISPFIKTKVC